MVKDTKHASNNRPESWYYISATVMHYTFFLKFTTSRQINYSIQPTIVKYNPSTRPYLTPHQPSPRQTHPSHLPHPPTPSHPQTAAQHPTPIVIPTLPVILDVKSKHCLSNLLLLDKERLQNTSWSQREDISFILRCLEIPKQIDLVIGSIGPFYCRQKWVDDGIILLYHTHPIHPTHPYTHPTYHHHSLAPLHQTPTYPPNSPPHF